MALPEHSGHLSQSQFVTDTWQYINHSNLVIYFLTTRILIFPFCVNVCKLVDKLQCINKYQFI